MTMTLIGGAAGTEVAQAAAGEVEFKYTGAAQTYVVPAGVTALQVEAWGAQGGIYDESNCDSGGFGGYTLATIAVAPGEALEVNVGGRGSSFSDADHLAGGFNGGGRGNVNAAAGSRGGGGASDVRRAPHGLDDRLVVAGGGGGAGSSSIAAIGGAGGPDGLAGGPQPSGGGGGTQDAGGAAGPSAGIPASPGSLGTGGDGGNHFGTYLVAGGGGGGGWYGGGGGGANGTPSDSPGGGGGGSSYGPPGSIFEPGVNGFSGQCNEPAEPGRVVVSPAPSDGTFHPLAPARILDTREGLGAAEAKVGAGDTVELQVTGRGGVPSTGVAAVMLNLTVAEPSDPGFITAYPCGDAQPFASNGNHAAGQSAGSATLVEVGVGGAVCIYTLASAHLIADVGGWVARDAVAVGARFTSLPPDRLLDTRDDAILPGGTEVQLTVLDRSGVPASGVSAVTFNLTVTEATGLGFLTAYPCGATRPIVSNVNYAPGQTVANLATVKLGEGGRICIYALSTTHVIADIAGWWGEEGATDGSRIAPSTPERNLDTRVGIGSSSRPVAAEGTIQVAAAGRNGIPATGVTAVVLSVAATNTSGPGYLTIYPCDVERPTASNLNYDAAGQTVANLVVVKLDPDGRYCVYSPTATDVLADVAGYLSEPDT